MRGHLVECYIILILQHRYVLRFRDMKRHRTFWGEGLCSVVWRLGERSGSHGWKGVWRDEIDEEAGSGEEGCRDVKRGSEEQPALHHHQINMLFRVNESSL